MPALVLFGRKWLIASDDFLIPCFVEAILRIILACITSYMLWLTVSDTARCSPSHNAFIYLFYTLVHLAVFGILSGYIAWISGQGTVMQVDERRLISHLLHLKTASFTLDFMVALCGGYIYHHLKNTCVTPVILCFLKVLVSVIVLYFLIVFICVLITYNSLGSSKFSGFGEKLQEISVADKKAKRVWTCRLTCLFCWLGPGHKNRMVFKDIATFFAAFFNLDLVPSDVLTALLILNEKHTEEKEKPQVKDSSTIHGLPYASEISCPSWMNCKNALHFLELAKSAYGWIRHDDICQAISKSYCSPCWNNQRVQGTDSCFNCNVSAIKKSTSFDDDDFIFVSYGAKIHEPSFFVAIDRSSSSIVIAIRGTFSFSDLVTALDANNESFRLNKGEDTDFYAHRGLYRSAQSIYQKLTELGILKRTFADHPDFKLVITGHSIGASTAVILALLMRNEYRDLRCYAFAPCAVLSASAVQLTLDFTFTIFAGDDFVPMFCTSTCNKLKMEILEALRNSDMQKYKVVLNACSTLLFKRKIFQASPRNMSNDSGKPNIPEMETCSVMECEEQLYAPGRILYLTKGENESIAHWESSLRFNRIFVSPNMWGDHTPRQIQEHLENVLQQSNSKDTSSIQITNTSSPSCVTHL